MQNNIRGDQLLPGNHHPSNPLGNSTPFDQSRHSSLPDIYRARQQQTQHQHQHQQQIQHQYQHQQTQYLQHYPQQRKMSGTPDISYSPNRNGSQPGLAQHRVASGSSASLPYDPSSAGNYSAGTATASPSPTRRVPLRVDTAAAEMKIPRQRPLPSPHMPSPHMYSPMTHSPHTQIPQHGIPQQAMDGGGSTTSLRNQQTPHSPAVSKPQYPERVARFGYTGQPPLNSSQGILRMPVPEIPPGVQSQLAQERPRSSESQEYSAASGSAGGPAGGPAAGAPGSRGVSQPHTLHSSHSVQNLNAPPAQAPYGSVRHAASAQNLGNSRSASASSYTTSQGSYMQPSSYTGSVVSSGSSNIQPSSRIPISASSQGPQLSVRSGESVFAPKHTRFGSDAGLPASDLTVEQFEAVRKHALTQPHDPRAQLELARRLCEASDHLAGRYTDPQHPSTMEVDARQQAVNREAWTSQALKIAKKLASRVQYPEALFFLGTLYSAGKYGADMDYLKAFECYQKAAKLEHPEASYRLAVCEEFGVGTRRNFEKAVRWYKNAAVLGSVGSMYKLAMISLLGSLDQPRDFNTGLVWLQRAAEKADSRNPHAVHELALLYERSPLSTYVSGDPIPHNEAKALEYFYIAAKLGYGPSQARLGRAFEFGELGCSVDPQWSISWYSQGAQQGDSDAELGMAGWYWTGSPQLRKNDIEAFLWAESSARKNNTRAMYAVGYFCERGIGVTRDMHRAVKWYTLAAEKKHPRAIQKLKTLD